MITTIEIIKASMNNEPVVGSTTPNLSIGFISSANIEICVSGIFLNSDATPTKISMEPRMILPIPILSTK